MNLKKQIVFVAGAHGAGKGFFCSKLAEVIIAKHISASELIRKRKSIGQAKAITGINENQSILVEELSKFRTKEAIVLLDGHFCLYDETFKVQKLPSELFGLLSIKASILLKCKPQIIMKRLNKRDSHTSGLSLENIQQLQEAEQEHSYVVANTLGIPLIEVDVSENLSDADMKQISTKIINSIES